MGNFFPTGGKNYSHKWEFFILTTFPNHGTLVTTRINIFPSDGKCIDKWIFLCYIMLTIQNERRINVHLKFIPKMKMMSDSTFKLYVYLIEMSDEYKNYYIDRSHAIKYTGLAKSTYYCALQELYNLNIVSRYGCHYILSGDIDG